MGHEGFVIRSVTDADMPQITSLYAVHVREGTASWEIEAPDQSALRARRDAIVAGGMPYVVAARAGEVLGFASAGPFRLRPAYRFTVENSVYVRADAMRQGVALSLLQRVIDDCTAAGFRQMVAVIGDSVDNPSIRLHEKMGFQRVGLIRNIGWKFDRWLDSVLMQLALGKGATTAPAGGSR